MTWPQISNCGNKESRKIKRDGRPYVMHPDVVAPDIDAIQAAPVCTPNGHVVNFTIRACVHREVKSGCIHKHNVMNGEICDLVQSQYARTCPAALCMDLVPIAYAL
jgi:hypothetical protein